MGLNVVDSNVFIQRLQTFFFLIFVTFLNFFKLFFGTFFYIYASACYLLYIIYLFI